MTPAEAAVIFMGGPALIFLAGLALSAVYGAWRLRR